MRKLKIISALLLQASQHNWALEKKEKRCQNYQKPLVWRRPLGHHVNQIFQSKIILKTRVRGQRLTGWGSLRFFQHCSYRLPSITEPWKRKRNAVKIIKNPLLKLSKLSKITNKFCSYGTLKNGAIQGFFDNFDSDSLPFSAFYFAGEPIRAMLKES